MQWMQFRPRRQRGEFDVVDLVVGLGLMVVVPFICVALVRVFGVETRSDARDFRAKPKLEKAPPDMDEIKARWRVATDLYHKNVKTYTATVKSTTDGTLKEHHRRWAIKCLEVADSELVDLKNLAGTESQFQRYVTRASSLQQKIKTDLKALHDLDTLGLDQQRRSLSESELIQQ